MQTSGTPAAKYTKDHFVIIDAIGVKKSQKTDSRPMEKANGMSLKEVLEGIAMGNRDEDMLSTLANRLIQLDRQISDKEKAAFAEKAGRKVISSVVKDLLHAYDADTAEAFTPTGSHRHARRFPEALQSTVSMPGCSQPSLNAGHRPF